MDFISTLSAVVVVAIIGLLLLLALEKIKQVYVIVPPGEAHFVVTPKGSFVASSDPEIATNDTRWYLNFPSTLPMIGRSVRVMKIGIQELVMRQETYEINQARFGVTSSAKYRIKKVTKAAQTYPDDATLKEQMKEVIQAAVRAVTAKYNIEDVRSKKSEVAQAIYVEIKDDFEKWGLELESFQLVDFEDTADSKVISNISKRREAQIAADTEIAVARKTQEAREAVAQANREAEKAEIDARQRIAEQEETSKQEIEKAKQKTVEEEMHVRMTEQTKAAEIEKAKNLIRQQEQKEKEIIKAEEEKEVAARMKEARELKAEASRIEKEKNALGEAAKIRADKEAEAEGIRSLAEADAERIRKIKGAEAEGIRATMLAEAEGKRKLAEALALYGPEEIQAMVAEQVVEAQKIVGLESAKAMAKADLKVFVGGDGGAADFGKTLAALQMSNDGFATSILNRVARPNDLGLSGLAVSATGLATEEKNKGKAKSAGWKVKSQEDDVDVAGN